MNKYVISIPFWGYLAEKSSILIEDRELSIKTFKENPPSVIFKNVNFIRELLSFKNKDITLVIGVVEEDSFSVSGNEIRKFIYNGLKLSLNYYNFLDEKNGVVSNLTKTKAGEVILDLSKFPEINSLRSLLSKLSTLKLRVEDKKPLFKVEVLSITETETLDYKPLSPHFVKYLYGSKHSLRSFSYLLSKEFHNKYKDGVGKTDFVVTSYKTKLCPLPCSKLRNLFCENFNVKGTLVDSLDFKPFVPTNIITREILEGKTLIFVEDVSTNLSRFLVEKFLTNSGYEGKVIFLNLINYKGKESNSEVTSSLGLGSLLEVNLLRILPDKKSEISININLVKYLLTCNTSNLLEFLSKDLDLSFTRKLYNYIILENLNREPSENLEIIKRTIKPLL